MADKILLVQSDQSCAVLRNRRRP